MEKTMKYICPICGAEHFNKDMQNCGCGISYVAIEAGVSFATVKDVLKIAELCGCSTLGEAVENVKRHPENFFIKETVEERAEEFRGICERVRAFMEKHHLSENDMVKDALAIIE